LLCVSNENEAEEAVSAAINEGIIRPSSYKGFVSTLDYASIAPAQAEANR